MMCFGLKDRKRTRTNHCIIVLLDDTQLVHELHQSTTGQDLLDVAIKHLNLLETSYFGLSYPRPASQHSRAAHLAPQGPTKGPSSAYYGDYYSAGSLAGQAQGGQAEQQWLDMSRGAIKQLRHLQPMTVYFGVKYYAPDPCKLAEEITRYQFFLQCKRDILLARLPVHHELAAELLALAVQSELGDFDPARHGADYVSEFQLVPKQTRQLEREAALWHRQLAGQVPATAELNFLERVKWLHLYGCELHPIQYDHDSGPGPGDSYALGLGPAGLLVVRNQLRVAAYAWPRIVRSKCQGRCLLVDVAMDLAAAGQQQQQANGRPRSRFGFRLADKEAARRLRWSLEQHKSFHQLLMQSQGGLLASPRPRAQLGAGVGAGQQQRPLEFQAGQLSQRFRNSIRSAIGFGLAAGGPSLQQLEQQHKKLLRSSVKSLGAAGAAERQAPTVVRMPSRRYRCEAVQQQRQDPLGGYLADGLAAPLPPAPLPPLGAPGSAHTMVDGQRHRALMLMADFGQQRRQLEAADQFCGPPIGKSQTLKPMSRAGDTKEAKHRNPYYQMMIMLAAQQHQAQLQQQLRAGQRLQGAPEIAILPPGQHNIQPNIYKAQSVVNGINQLGTRDQQQQQQQRPDVVLMRQASHGPYASPSMTLDRRYVGRASGQESPRSTRSAVAPSSALKLASKKLASRQQQQLIYGNHQQANGLRPLIADNGKQFYNDATNAGPSNPSPRSARSFRMLQAADHNRHQQTLAVEPTLARQEQLHLRSKSTGENLHLLHQQQHYLADVLPKAASRMLLTTATNQVQLGSLPPPDYNADGNTSGPLMAPNNGLLGVSSNCGQGKTRPRSLSVSKSKQQQQQQHRPSKLRAEEDYYCSRSDCSSIVDANDDIGLLATSPSRQRRPIAPADSTQRSRFISGQLVNANRQQSKPLGYDNDASGLNDGQGSLSRSQEALYGPDGNNNNKQQQLADWHAIKRRHNEFSHGKGPLGQFDIAPRSNTNTNELKLYTRDTNNSNNNVSGRHNGAEPVKNIANKQATPILLTMNQGGANQQQSANSANNKAVQMLNMQRKQLLNTHQLDSMSDANNNNSKSNNLNAKQMPPTNRGGSTSTGPDQTPSISATSSNASSPRTPLGASGQLSKPMGQLNQRRTFNGNTSNTHHQAADSTGSNSTTSGYYPGSNSTGPASVDSGDTLNGPECNRVGSPLGVNGRPSPRQQRQQIQGKSFNSNTSPTDRCSTVGKKLSNSEPINQPLTSSKNREYHNQQQHFFLDEGANQNDTMDSSNGNKQKQATGNINHRQQHWSPLEQIQQHPPSSLKYVSFDV